MWRLLTPPAYKTEQTGPEADAKYKRLRWQVFLGIFIGYAGFYIVRKNFSMAIPMLADFGFEKGELGVVLSMNAIAYGFSKFIMASISDRSNARTFLPLGLTMAAISMLFMIVPIQWIGAEHKSLALGCRCGTVRTMLVVPLWGQWPYMVRCGLALGSMEPMKSVTF